MIEAIFSIAYVIVGLSIFIFFGAFVALAIGGDFSDGVKKPPLSPEREPVNTKMINRTWGEP